MSDFYLKVGDTSPSLVATLKDANGAINLTSATGVTFSMGDSSTLKIENAACTIVTAASGVVEYEWVAGDTDTASSYDFEFRITWADATTQTVPNYRTGRVKISESL